MAKCDYLIVGLGNPGAKYARHRHNIGFMVVDRIADDEGAAWQEDKGESYYCPMSFCKHSVVLAKPLSYMNLSGRPVVRLVRKFSVDYGNIVVIHDDMDLIPGRIRVKIGGGDGGHKGVRSIADSLRFRDFLRVRLGVGRPPEGMPPERFVLAGFRPDEEDIRTHLIEHGIKALELLLNHGLEQARNKIHAGMLG